MLNIGSFYKTNSCGDVVILDNVGKCKCKVMFVDTGYIKISSYGNIRRGCINDPMKPSVMGVGFIGDGEFKARDGGRASNAYSVWLNMIRRCYSEKVQEKHPTYKGCTVDKEWHNFQNFAEWFYKNHSEGLHLDKDTIVDGNKVYSPGTCCFISQGENTTKAHAKKYTITSPEGNVLKIKNLNSFCRDNNLDASNVLKVLSGKYSHCNGWTEVKKGWF